MSKHQKGWTLSFILSIGFLIGIISILTVHFNHIPTPPALTSQSQVQQYLNAQDISLKQTGNPTNAISLGIYIRQAR